MEKARLFSKYRPVFAFIFRHDRIVIIPLFSNDRRITQTESHALSRLLSAEFVFDRYECVGPVLFNHTSLAQRLRAYEPGMDAPVVIVLDEPYLHELICTQETCASLKSPAHVPVPESISGDTPIPELLPHYVYDCRRIIDNRYYVAGMPAYLCFQCRLMLGNASCVLYGITTHTLVRAHVLENDPHLCEAGTSIADFKKAIVHAHRHVPKDIPELFAPSYLEGLHMHARQFVRAYR